MARRLSHVAALVALRKHALAYPGAAEEFPWGDRVAKVNQKIFVFLGRDADPAGLRLSVKLPTSCAGALLLPFTAPTGYGLGKAGWVSVTIPPDEAPPVELLLAWIDESYRAIAPKRVVATLDAKREDGATPRAKARR
ncbi:MAG: MmcQ/YjbR family DNA-binding protein [Myxococcales bacterium]|nr:MmcQ/YjbR family DNA-binding protein [Myxococcales bacterium]